MAKKRGPDPLEPGHIPGQNAATPQRMPGHTRHYDSPSDQSAIEYLTDEQDDALDEALRGTFPASDPVSLESPLITRRSKGRRGQNG